MNEVLAMCGHLPELRVAKGSALIERLVHTSRMFILREGGFQVVRDGVAIVEITEPGAFLGEIGALLDCVPTATVRAMAPFARRAAV